MFSFSKYHKVRIICELAHFLIDIIIELRYDSLVANNVWKERSRQKLSHKETVLYSMKMVDNLVRKLMDRHITADKQGLTIMHTWIVGFLYNNPERDVYQRDIEREFRVNRATVSSMISLMEQKGLIRRLSVSHDGRLKKLELTQLGRELHEKQVQRFEALESRMENCLTPQELQELFVICDKLRTTLETLVQNDKGGE